MTSPQYLKRTIVKETVVSRYLPEGSRELRVYLPPGYNEIISYPVIYCQDGEDFFNFGRIATLANKLILEADMEPIIIVGVDVDKSKRTAEYAPDGDRHASYIRFFVEEMIPYVASRYTVRDEPGQVILAGDSLGATVSLHIALAYPGRFTKLISFSGAYFPVSRELTRQHPESLEWLKLFMTVGLQETAFETTDRGVYDFVALNRDMKAVLESKGAGLTYIERDGLHQWGYWQKQVPEALEWAFNSTAL